MANWTVPESVDLVLFARRALATAWAVFALWLVAAFALFHNFPDTPGAQTDAVIMLGGASNERLPVAEQLQESLGIPVLVVSHTNTPGNVSADALCQGDSARPGNVVCLELDQKDTRGEARAIGQLVAANGWNSISVVTSRYHMARAGLVISQCTPARISLRGSSPDLNLKQWMDRFVVETGGLLDVTLRPECS